MITNPKNTQTAIYLYLAHICKGEKKTAADIKNGLFLHFNLSLSFTAIYYHLKKMEENKEIKAELGQRNKNNIPYATYFAEIQTGNIAKNKKIKNNGKNTI